MLTKPRHSIAFIITVILLLCGFTAWANDEELPIEIQADSMQMDFKKGQSEYSGNVLIRKGNITLQGDQIFVSRLNDEIERIRVTGKPARYKQQNTLDTITAQSDTMLFEVKSNLLSLTNNAQLKQNDQVIESQHIQFDTVKQILIGGGKQTGSSKQRVNIILSPKQDN